MDEHIDCAHRAAIRREVQTALLRHAGFPPPPPSTLVLARFRRAAAWSATYARVAFRIEGMSRNIMPARV